MGQTGGAAGTPERNTTVAFFLFIRMKRKMREGSLNLNEV